MLPMLTPQKASAMLRSGEARLIDLREPDEYAGVRIPQTRLIPLSIVFKHPLKDEGAPDLPIIFACRSGGRTRSEAKSLARLAPNSYQLEGGIIAWERAGLPVERGRARLSLFRQIQIGAGSLVLLGSLGGSAWPPLYWLSVFVGAGLVFAGVSGFCGLGLLLAHMPWNKRQF
jgi:rhodanese-related sulfurtransferase